MCCEVLGVDHERPRLHADRNGKVDLATLDLVLLPTASRKLAEQMNAYRAGVAEQTPRHHAEAVVLRPEDALGAP
jgi:hypothetical protein